ncbi:cerebellin-1-like isoform X2 [Argopecten irradians]|uniref:cerebellin-1-like isoform X2 n=1 Tax=Argopecten irradians TaxID=31199 RepID=UPI00372301FE
MSSIPVLQLLCIFSVIPLVTCNSDVTKETLSSLQQQVQKLQTAFQHQNEYIKELKDDAREQKENFEKRIKYLEDANNNMKDHCQIQCRGQQKRDANAGIGFSASLSTSTALGDHQIIVFDTVVSNDGNGYDSRHGHFTAPVTGLYAFSVTAMCYGSETELHISIVKDGQKIGVAFANGNHYDNGSKLVVVPLQEGQMVWVEHFGDPSGNKIYGNTYSTFSGFLIQAY